jgi:glycosyltransferase A (GT-A) superfamily protein (DUF2064 family)
MRRNAAILFVGEARREEARKGLPARFLARLHRELAAVIESVDHVDLYIAADRGATFVLDGPAFTSRSSQLPLGAKVEEALASCFAAGYARVAIVAGDVAGLTRGLVVEAFAQARPAIGRSPDGGFYLAAFSAPPAVAWQTLPWSTADIHDELFAQLPDPHTLPPLHDIDSLGDALVAVRAVANLRIRARLLSLLLRRTPLAARRLPHPPDLALTGEAPRPPPAA